MSYVITCFIRNYLFLSALRKWQASLKIYENDDDSVMESRICHATWKLSMMWLLIESRLMERLLETTRGRRASSTIHLEVHYLLEVRPCLCPPAFEDKITGENEWASMQVKMESMTAPGIMCVFWDNYPGTAQKIRVRISIMLTVLRFWSCYTIPVMQPQNGAWIFQDMKRQFQGNIWEIYCFRCCDSCDIFSTWCSSIVCFGNMFSSSPALFPFVSFVQHCWFFRWAPCSWPFAEPFSSWWTGCFCQNLTVSTRK